MDSKQDEKRMRALVVAHYYDFDTYENRLALMEEVRSLNEDFDVTLIQTVPKDSTKKPLYMDVPEIHTINVEVPNLDKSGPFWRVWDVFIYNLNLNRAIKFAGVFDMNFTFSRQLN